MDEKYNEREHEQFRENINNCVNSITELAKTTNGKLERVHDKIDDVHERVNNLTTETNARFQALSAKIIAILVGIVLTLLSVPASFIWNRTISQEKAGIDKTTFISINQKIDALSGQITKSQQISSENHETLNLIKKKYGIKNGQKEEK